MLTLYTSLPHKDVSEEIKKTKSKASAVNNGCEINFAVLDWHGAKTGKSMPISTVSDLEAMSYKRYLESKKINDRSYLAAQYKWARSSEKAKKK